MHVILSCQVYDDLREPLLAKAFNCEPIFIRCRRKTSLYFYFQVPIYSVFVPKPVSRSCKEDKF